MDVTTASTDETDTIADLWVDLARDQRHYGSELLAEPNRMVIRETILERVVTENLLVAREDDSIVGFVMLSLEVGRYKRTATRGLIENIYVRPEYRRRGIGTALLRAAESALADAGAETIGLEVMSENESARRFYSAHGYASHRLGLQKSTENDTL